MAIIDLLMHVDTVGVDAFHAAIEQHNALVRLRRQQQEAEAERQHHMRRLWRERMDLHTVVNLRRRLGSVDIYNHVMTFVARTVMDAELHMALD